MEIAAFGVAILVVVTRFGPVPAQDLILNMLLLWVLITLFATDVLWMRLPDVLTLTLCVVAVLLANDKVAAFFGGALGVAVFAGLRWGYWKIRGREGLGLGDVKLMAGLGALSGPLDLPLLVLVAALLALAGAAGLRLSGRKIDGTTAVPFGAFLVVSGMLIWLARTLGSLPPL
ncbi:Type IV leader peptidase family protein [Shimia haliotis]|uniref:Type IV leader peptidase family protein n=2 Tax=Shimia haliotis TaxID=1280847 RepID=A0A1I4EM57_9RHOB|nr:Type IV leader peptidase family protein [Shimia haliotis]